MPFVGMSTDGAYDVLDFYFRNSQPESNRVCVRAYGGGINAIYIKDGKPTEPYGSILVPTAFRKNGWSSNSYDIGGFIFLKCGEKDPFFTKQPSEAFAFCADNSMIDRDNATWGEDYYRIEIIGIPGARATIEEYPRIHNKYTYDVTLNEDGICYQYFKLHLNGSVSITHYGDQVQTKTRKLRHGLNQFRFTAYEGYIMSSPYFDDENDVFTSVNGRDYSKTNPGPAYCFMEWCQQSGWCNPLVISMEADATEYYPPGGVAIRSVVYNGQTWYYRGFSYGWQTNPTSALRYIDVTPSAVGTPTEEDIVLYCLRYIYESN
jgi:hypothetical protein